MKHLLFGPHVVFNTDEANSGSYPPAPGAVETAAEPIGAEGADSGEVEPAATEGDGNSHPVDAPGNVE